MNQAWDVKTKRAYCVETDKGAETEESSIKAARLLPLLEAAMISLVFFIIMPLRISTNLALLSASKNTAQPHLHDSERTARAMSEGGKERTNLG